MTKMRNEVVERELTQFVEAVKEIVPLLTEIRVFGSYNNGNWDSKRSDVDIFVETGDESLSVFRNCRLVSQLGFYGTRESEEREIIRKKIIQELNGEYFRRFAIHIHTTADLRRTWWENDGRGPLGKNMKNGRLLYPTNLPMVVPQLNVDVQI